MAYVATKGGEEAIAQSELFYQELKGGTTKDTVNAILKGLPYLVDRVMGEAAMYARELAALAIAQTGGDLSEAVLILRAYRTTLPRLGFAETLTEKRTTTVRRISAAFKDIPGGQFLGPSLDYSHRLLQLDVLDDYPSTFPKETTLAETAASKSMPFLTSWQKKHGLIDDLSTASETAAKDIPDLTQEPLLIPAPREHRLQALARADTGGVLALGYANMRGYGSVHPTVNELRLSYANVEMKHPKTGVTFCLGKIRTCQGEVVSTFSEKQKEGKLDLGFAATMGWNEIKIIAASMLDMAMDLPEPHPSHTEEYVLYHTDIVESSGFCVHYKLPHYVTFASTLDNLREVRKKKEQTALPKQEKTTPSQMEGADDAS